jgi:hypothetical protein
MLMNKHSNCKCPSWQNLKSAFAQNSASKQDMCDILSSPLEDSIQKLVGHIWEKGQWKKYAKNKN